MLEYLITQIQDRLLAADINEQVPTLQYVDLDWGQLDNYAEHPPVKFPCALLDLRNLQHSNNADGIQITVGEVEVRLFDKALNTSSGAASPIQKANSLRILRLCDKAHAALHGWSIPLPTTPTVPTHTRPDVFATLTRTASGRTKRTDGIKEMRITFRVAMTDAVAQPQRTHYSATVIP